MCPQKPSIKDDDDHDDDEKQEDIECTVEWSLFFLSSLLLWTPHAMISIGNGLGQSRS